MFDIKSNMILEHIDPVHQYLYPLIKLNTARLVYWKNQLKFIKNDMFCLVPI